MSPKIFQMMRGIRGHRSGSGNASQPIDNSESHRDNDDARNMPDPRMAAAQTAMSRSVGGRAREREDQNPFEDINRIPQNIRNASQNEGKSSMERESAELVTGYFQPSGVQQRSTPSFLGDWNLNGRDSPYRQTEISATETDYGSIHNQVDVESGMLPAHPRKNVHDELSRVQVEIQQAAHGVIDDSQLSNTIRKYGPSGALRLLLERQRLALGASESLSRIEEKIRAAAEGNVRPSYLEAEFRKGGAEGALQLLLRYYQSAVEAEQALTRVTEKLRSKSYDIPPQDINYASNNGGAEAMLEQIFEDYDKKRSASQVLGHVIEQIRQASSSIGQEDAELALQSGRGGVENALKKLLGAYQHSVEAHKELNRVDDELRRVSRGLSWTHDMDVVLRQSGTERALSRLVEHLQTTAEGLRTRNQGLESHNANLDHRLRMADSDNLALKGQLTQSQTEINDLTASHAADLTNADRAWREILQKHQSEADNQAELIGQRHRDELQRRQSDYQREMATSKAKFQSLQDQLEDERRGWKASLDAAGKEFNIKLVQMQQDHEDREEEIRKQFLERTEQYRLDNEVLKGELVRREHFKGLSDPEISSRFKRLTGEVDSFSRIPWEKKRESFWPIQETALRRSENPRKLKQHVVQSSIWMILKDRIFFSPFRVLGDEGLKLHGEWTSHFGQDHNSELPHWPEATIESEKWRHEQIKALSEALKKPDTEGSRSLKRAYEESLRAAVDDIHKAVQAISDLSAGDLQIVQEFVRQAATFWLEVASQKCRIYIVFPAHGAKALLHRKTASATLDLVIQPEVRRRGNAQGEGFVKEQVVKGCEGDCTKF